MLRQTAEMGSISYDVTPLHAVVNSSPASAAGSQSSGPHQPHPEGASPPEAADAPDDRIQRLGNRECCRCRCCTPMETVVQCICCQEYPPAVCMQPGSGCITTHPQFEALCLDRNVLMLAYLNMRYYLQKNMGASANEHYRFAAYRQCALWLWVRLDKSNRRPLPSCVLKAIRGRYPSNGYVGYLEAE